MAARKSLPGTGGVKKPAADGGKPPQKSLATVAARKSLPGTGGVKKPGADPLFEALEEASLLFETIESKLSEMQTEVNKVVPGLLRNTNWKPRNKAVKELKSCLSITPEDQTRLKRYDLEHSRLAKLKRVLKDLRDLYGDTDTQRGLLYVLGRLKQDVEDARSKVSDKPSYE